MAYDTPTTQDYGPELGTITLTSGASLNIRGPRGKKGLVRDIEVDVTTSINATTVSEVDVGISSADASYGRFRLGTTVSTGYGTGVKRASVVAGASPGQVGTNPVTYNDFANHVEIMKALIPADTDIVLSTTIASSAGAGRVRVRIAWF